MYSRGLRGFSLAAILLLAALLAGASTKLVMSWKNPNYAGKHFKKILVVGMSQNLAIRANFEDDLAAKLAKPGIDARGDPGREPGVVGLGHGHLRTALCLSVTTLKLLGICYEGKS